MALVISNYDALISDSINYFLDLGYSYQNRFDITISFILFNKSIL